jgi:hypothetical protein
MALEIKDTDLGGARVRLTFATVLKDGTQRRFRADEHLTRDEVLSFRNRRDLASAGYIEPYPLKVITRERDAASKPADRFIVGIGKGQYNVIEGHRLNAEPLTRDQADALAQAK